MRRFSSILACILAGTIVSACDLSPSQSYSATPLTVVNPPSIGNTPPITQTSAPSGASGVTGPSGSVYAQDSHVAEPAANISYSCDSDSCVGNVEELIDTLVEQSHATLIQLTLGLSVVNDPAYLDSIVEIVDYVGTMPGVSVLITPSSDSPDELSALHDALDSSKQVLWSLGG